MFLLQDSVFDYLRRDKLLAAQGRLVIETERCGNLNTVHARKVAARVVGCNFGGGVG